MITTKEQELVADDSLCCRIDEATRYVPLENLTLGTQCGFASTLLENLIFSDDVKRKIELVAKVARKV